MAREKIREREREARKRLEREVVEVGKRKGGKKMREER